MGGCMAAEPDDLAAWIDALRARLARGELDGQGSFDTSDGILPVGLAARIMLADLDHYEDLTPEQRGEPLVIARRLHLLADFCELRARIG